MKLPGVVCTPAPAVFRTCTGLPAIPMIAPASRKCASCACAASRTAGGVRLYPAASPYPIVRNFGIVNQRSRARSTESSHDTRPIVKPQTHKFRARRCWTDSPRSQVYAVFLQHLERFAQRAHIVEVKRQVVDRVRMWCAFEEPDDHRVVRQPDGIIGPAHFLQLEVLGPKLRALLWVFDGKAEMPDRAKLYFHVRTLLSVATFGGRARRESAFVKNRRLCTEARHYMSRSPHS